MANFSRAVKFFTAFLPVNQIKPLGQLIFHKFYKIRRFHVKSLCKLKNRRNLGIFYAAFDCIHD